MFWGGQHGTGTWPIYNPVITVSTYLTNKSSIMATMPSLLQIKYLLMYLIYRTGLVTVLKSDITIFCMFQIISSIQREWAAIWRWRNEVACTYLFKEQDIHLHANSSFNKPSTFIFPRISWNWVQVTEEEKTLPNIQNTVLIFVNWVKLIRNLASYLKFVPV